MGVLLHFFGIASPSPLVDWITPFVAFMLLNLFWTWKETKLIWVCLSVSFTAYVPARLHIRPSFSGVGRTAGEPLRKGKPVDVVQVDDYTRHVMPSVVLLLFQSF